MRQHVNPLSRFFQLPRDLPGPSELFEKSQLPIHLDIGCARGDFLLNMASMHESWNYLGLEIRLPLVQSANKDKQARNLGNLAFLFCNANVSLDEWLFALPKGQLQRVSIQFPDPWFKRRHRKRRVLQPSLLLSIARSLSQGKHLFIQTDIFEVFQQMSSLIEESQYFDQSKSSKAELLTKNCFPIPTEREAFVISQGSQIYRALYTRNNHMIPKILDL